MDPPAAQSRASDSGISVLPPDCLLLVLATLPAEALARFLQASPLMRAIASSPALWRRHCASIWPEDAAPASPSRYARHVHLFRGVLLCCTGMAPEAKAKAHRWVESMGGRCECDMSLTGSTGGVKATHVLCGDASTDKARAARGRTRLLRPEWLHDSLREARLLPAEDYAAPQLLGARVCATGLSISLRARAAADVATLGGVFDDVLSKRTTHLLVQLRKGDQAAVEALLGSGGPSKLLWARRAGVRVLDVGWLAECLAQCHTPSAAAVSYHRHLR